MRRRGKARTGGGEYEEMGSRGGRRGEMRRKAVGRWGGGGKQWRKTMGKGGRQWKAAVRGRKRGKSVESGGAAVRQWKSEVMWGGETCGDMWKGGRVQRHAGTRRDVWRQGSR